MITRIDTAKEHFDPKKHPTQAVDILNEIVKFNKKYNDTFTLFGFKAMSVSLPAVPLWFVGGAWAWIGIPLLGLAIAFGKDSVFYSPASQSQWQSFTKDAERLLELYDWCCRTGSQEVTKDEIFLQLLRTIAPFTKDMKKLAPQHLRISDECQKILEQWPHRFLFDESRLLKDGKSSVEQSTELPELVRGGLASMKFLLFNCDKSKQNAAKSAPLREDKSIAHQISEGVNDGKNAVLNYFGFGSKSS